MSSPSRLSTAFVALFTLAGAAACSTGEIGDNGLVEGAGGASASLTSVHASSSSGVGATSTSSSGATSTAGATTSSGASTSSGTSSAGGASASSTASASSGAGAGGAGGGPSSTRLTQHPLGSTSSPQGFYEYIPPGYPNGNFPLLFALHGLGENGDGMGQLTGVLNAGIARLISQDKWPEDRPFVVLAPQHSGGGCPSSDEIKAFITWGMQSYSIDPKRVYLTGLSCGGIGAWSYLGQELDNQIAAMVPIAGDGQGAWNNQKCNLGRVAIWAFHGDLDGTVGVAGTNVPMDGLAGCPSPPRLDAKKTIYPGVGHDSWDQTYDLSAGNDIYTWMLGFTHP